MIAEIFWITDFLATMPRPRGNDWLEDEILSYKKFGVDVIVSLLEMDEIIELELEKERSFCEQHEIEFLDFPISDYQTPNSFEETRGFVKKLNGFLLEKKRVAIHCRQGIGRASLIAACVLIFQGVAVEKVFGLITEKRNRKVPDTQQQIDWVKQFAQRIYE